MMFYKSTVAMKAMNNGRRIFMTPTTITKRMSIKTFAMQNDNKEDIAKFIQSSYTPYDGDDSFLAKPTKRTIKILDIIRNLSKEELKKGILDVDTTTPSSITAFPPGYIDQPNELIVGLQTDKPLKRAIKPNGGVNMVKSALESYNYQLDPTVDAVFTKYRKTHNDGVFDAYTKEMLVARKSGILTGLPDGYGRGRIIGDYRRVPYYGVDAIIDMKQRDKTTMLSSGSMTQDLIQLREEVSEQIKALKELKDMALSYGFDISKPARDSKEALQWLYFAYLAAVKEQDGAAMSLGRIDAFLDIYIERDLKQGRYSEEQIQEMIDDFVIKLRIVKQLRTPEYNALFSGDPTWVTASLAGVNASTGKHMVTKTTFRILNTLYNLGAAPEPNITVLWSIGLPAAFKRFCAKVSIDTSSIQYENDDLMKPRFGSDYGIACCVSAMEIGKDMQFFGARANLPKLLLYVLNQGKDEITGTQVGPKFAQIAEEGKPLDYEVIKTALEIGMDWLATLYCNTMNIIHYMHDKYNYERIQMALHDTHVRRLLAFGISGLSVVIDSLSAIKHAEVYPIFDKTTGLITDFDVKGSYPMFGNDDDSVDEIGKWVVSTFYKKLAAQGTYRESVPTLSVLTITSNVVYGKKTGTTPDGRKSGEPFAPGANPLHGRDSHGAIASLASVAKLPYEYCMDGISNTFNVLPHALGKGDMNRRCDTLVSLIDGYFTQNAHHLNVNVLNKEMLLDAIEHPENYPNLTIRISGYAVVMSKLTHEQQLEFIKRTFHENM